MTDLESEAAAVLRDPGEADAFRRRLLSVCDVEQLRNLAQRHTPDIEVSIPVYRRLLEVAPGDVEAIAALGFVFFLAGEDELAWRQVAAGRVIQPEHLDVLTLEAALTADRPQKKRLYERILQIDPGNQVALENRRELERDSD